MPVELDVVRQLAADANHLAVVATTRPDGTIHASLVSAGVIDDPVTSQPSIGIVVGGDAAKLRHLRRTPHAAAVFQAGFRWVTVDGPVRLVAEVTAAAVSELALAEGGPVWVSVKATEVSVYPA